MSPSRTAKANFSLDFSLEDSSSGDGARLEIDQPPTPSQDSNEGCLDNIYTFLEKMESSNAPSPSSSPIQKNRSIQKNSSIQKKAKEPSTEPGSVTPPLKQLQNHPCFLNSTNIEEVSKKLEIVGSFYIIPDQNASNQAILLWKVCNGVYQSTMIKEEADESQTYLVIKGTKYGNLDEVLEKFLDPLVSYAKEIQAFKYYLDIGSLRKVAEQLLKQKKKEPSKIHYVLSPSSQHPGNFVISFLPKTECKHEFIVPRPEGLYYRRKVFPSLKKLLAFHKDDPMGIKVPREKTQQKHSITANKKDNHHHSMPTQNHRNSGKKNKVHVEVLGVKSEKRRKESVEEALSPPKTTSKAPNPITPAPSHIIAAPNPVIPAPSHIITALNPIIPALNPMIPTPNSMIPAPNPMIQSPNSIILSPNPIIPALNPITLENQQLMAAAPYYQPQFSFPNCNPSSVPSSEVPSGNPKSTRRRKKSRWDTPTNSQQNNAALCSSNMSGAHQQQQNNVATSPSNMSRIHQDNAPAPIYPNNMSGTHRGNAAALMYPNDMPGAQEQQQSNTAAMLYPNNMYGAHQQQQNNVATSPNNMSGTRQDNALAPIYPDNMPGAQEQERNNAAAMIYPNMYGARQDNAPAPLYPNNNICPPVENFSVPPPPFGMPQCFPPFNPSIPPPPWTDNFN